MKQTRNFNSLKSQVNQSIIASGMTFDSSVDCRKDLVNHHGYTVQQVNKMSDDQVYSIMDEFDDEKCIIPSYEEALPVQLKDSKCKCGSELKVLFVDTESRGDCEIYFCMCTKCSQTTELSFADEWYE